MSDLLLDTCAVLWIAEGSEISAQARKEIATRNLHVSPISAWEIANLARKSRISLTMPTAAWFRQTAQKMQAAMSQLNVDVLAGSCELPGLPPSDPADRIIIATARDAGLTVMTRDEKILSYSRAGHVRAMAC
jgi:PIN domain nuclease of toxin-antitoxin system